MHCITNLSFLVVHYSGISHGFVICRCYSRSNYTKSPSADAGNVGVPRLMPHVGRVCKV